VRVAFDYRLGGFAKVFSLLLIGLVLFGMSSDPAAGVGSEALSISSGRFRKPFPRRSQSDSLCLLESEHAASVVRNDEMRLQLFQDCALTVVPQPKKLPKFSKKVVKTPQRVQPARAKKTPAPPPIDHLPPRTASKKGSWTCVKGCSQESPTLETFLTHLKGAHGLTFDVLHLAPLGLAPCPFCDGVFASFRGIANHMRSCVYPRRSLLEMEKGPFPAKCFVWWSAQSGCWYEGLATPSDNHCWSVVYPDSPESYLEHCYVVTFITPSELPALPEIEGGVLDCGSLDAGLSPISVGSVARSLSMGSPSSSTSVLAACGVEDMSLSFHAPSQAPEPSLSVPVATQVSLEPVVALPSTQLWPSPRSSQAPSASK